MDREKKKQYNGKYGDAHFLDSVRGGWERRAGKGHAS